MSNSTSFSLKSPCYNCPWRKDKTVAPAEMFPKDRYESMQECVKQGLGKPIFACHNTPEEKPKACAGYLIVEGAVNFSVRIAIIQGRLNLEELHCDDELYESYEEMAMANGVYLGEIER